MSSETPKPPAGTYTSTVEPDVSGISPEAVVPGISDLNTEALETLGSWMLGVTERNYFAPERPLEVSDNEDSNQSLGTPASSVISGEESTDNGFMQTVTEVARIYYENISDGGTPAAMGGGALGNLTTSGLLDKTSQTQGHELLAKIVGDEWSAIMSQSPTESEEPHPKSQLIREKVSEVLNHNRFQPGGASPYIDDKDYSHGMFTLQKQLGRYQPSQEEEGAAFDALAKIAFSSMIAATGGSGAGTSKDGAITDGIPVQIGLTRVDTADMRPNISSIGGTNAISSTDSLIDQDGILWKYGLENNSKEEYSNKSYGVLNSHVEQFGGPMPIGMIVLAVLAAVATIIAALVISLICSLLLLFGPEPSVSPPYPYPMGARNGMLPQGKASFSSVILEFLGVPRLKTREGAFDFFISTLEGCLMFFFRISDVISSGYFLVVSRAAMRDLEQISDAMEQAEFASVTGAAEGVFLLLESFATSTSWRFTMQMARLGDIINMSGGLLGKRDMPLSPEEGGVNAPNSARLLIQNLHLKSRSKTIGENSDYRRALRFGSLPTKYLLPVSVLGSNAALGRNKAFNALAKSQESGYGFDALGNKIGKFGGFKSDKQENTVRGGRFTASERMEIENQLESYYFPFYFQDLRTNEILALHTFVEGLTDSFTPQWNQVTGFGRMDDIQIYKSTKRNMGLSFYMVATSPADMDELYYGINKLVTMVYPQWSKGTQKQTADGEKFIIPFSQVPTASPLVRLRLGELWSSNYSLANIARLFGLGTDSFQVKGGGKFGDSGSATEVNKSYGHSSLTDASVAEEKYNEVLETIQKKLKNVNTSPTPMEALTANSTALTGLPLIVQPENGYNIGWKVIVNADKYDTLGTNLAVLNMEKTGKSLKIDKNASQNERKGEVIGFSIQPIDAITGGREGSTGVVANLGVADAKFVKYAVKLEHQKNSDDQNIIMCTEADLQPDFDDVVSDTINTVLAGAGGAFPNPFKPPAPAVTFEKAVGISNFFSDAGDGSTQNSIIRSFKESGGRGIAGAITSLDFDWNMAPWGEEYGSRAPTYVKVTIGFSPIHDIPLGLDQSGGIRAPAYNVGNIVRNIFGTQDEESIEAALAAANAGSQPAVVPADAPAEPPAE